MNVIPKTLLIVQINYRGNWALFNGTVAENTKHYNVFLEVWASLREISVNHALHELEVHALRARNEAVCS